MKFGMQAMSHPLVYLRPTRITYVRVTGPYETSIPQAWEKMFAWIDKNGLSSPVGHGFGLARDNPKIVDPKNCRYDACIEMKPHFEERAIRELGRAEQVRRLQETGKLVRRDQRHVLGVTAVDNHHLAIIRGGVASHQVSAAGFCGTAHPS